MGIKLANRHGYRRYASALLRRSNGQDTETVSYIINKTKDLLKLKYVNRIDFEFNVDEYNTITVGELN